MPAIKQFEVRKDDLAEARIVEQEPRPLAEGEAVAKVDRFALTANNVTYGVVGERIGYWNFFPADDEGWGVIPVWGVAEIEPFRAGAPSSRCEFDLRHGGSAFGRVVR